MNEWDMMEHVPPVSKRTYVFVFVPVYVEKKSAAVASTSVEHGWLAKLRRKIFRQDRQSHLPFWTWFIDNPSPSPIAPVAPVKKTARKHL